MYVLAQEGMNDDTLDNLKWYNLFGDPSMWWRTTPPTHYNVQHSLGRGLLTVEARGEDGKPAEGLTVAVSDPAEPYPIAVTRTSAEGKATLDLSVHRATGTVLTVSGENAETFQTTLP
jgi:hypothetical protein